MHFRYLSLILSASTVLALPAGTPIDTVVEHSPLGGTHGMGEPHPAGHQGVHPPRALDSAHHGGNNGPSKSSLSTPMNKVPNPVKVGLGRDELNRKKPELPIHAGKPHPPSGANDKVESEAASEKHEHPVPVQPGGAPKPPVQPVKAPSQERAVDVSAKEKAPIPAKNPTTPPAVPHPKGPVKATVERDVAANAAVHQPHGKSANGKSPVDHKPFTDSKGPLDAENNNAPGKAPSKVTVSRGHTDASAHVEPKPDEAIQKSHAEAVNHDQ